MSNDARLFTVVVESTQTVEELLNNLAAAVERRDNETVQMLDKRLRVALTLGATAVHAHLNRNRN